MYQADVDGQHHELGTSGFLYRSNKLMYDQKTNSLWSTLQGEPVVGKLVDKGIKLERLSVVTTTWRKWRQRHSDTTVLSLNTGHARDYGEGVAYQQYFATDNLMFGVPDLDDRLRNKDEVLALRKSDQQLAISVDFLSENSVYQDKLAGTGIVVFSDADGTSRVFASNGITFIDFDGYDQATDKEGNRWLVSEDRASHGNQSLPRVASHRAFWFGWHAQYPETRLVK